MHKLLKKFTVDFLNNDVKRINLIFKKSYKKIINKNNNNFDPVTAIDLKLEKIVIKKIKYYFPTHNITSEEEGYLKSSNNDYDWFVDPLDGTKNYILGFDYFSILIGLFHKNNPIFSLIYYPKYKKSFFSIKKKAYQFDLNTKKIKFLKSNKFFTNNFTKIVTNSKNTIKNNKVIKFFDNKNFIFKISGADSYNYVLLAMKKIDIVIESGLKDVDIVPLFHLFKINNIDYINWKGNKKIYKKNNSLIFFNNNKKNKKIVNSFLNKIRF